jgi:serine protease Do
MNLRATALSLAFLLCLGALFVSGFNLGRSGTVGRAGVRELDPAALKEVLGQVDGFSKPFVAASIAARPGVVHIITTRLVEIRDPAADFWEFFEGTPQRRRRRIGRQQATGSGAVVDSRGFILTNAHVVRDASEILIHLADGRVLPAQPVEVETRIDLAVVKVDARNLPVIPLGDSDKLEVGQWVIAIGNPFGLEQTVTTGIVSAVGRSGIGVAEDVEDFIQTDTPINPGNSGGPLVDLQGRIMGINTAIFSRSGGYQGIGFAIPINFARRRMLTRLEK